MRKKQLLCPLKPGFCSRDDINFQNYLSTKTVTTSLVDHHVLSEKEHELENTVVHILDHRPVDPCSKWDKNKVSIRIEEVGSCCTLIADEILRDSVEFSCKELAYLLYREYLSFLHLI